MRARDVVLSLSLLVLGCARSVVEPAAAPPPTTAPVSASKPDLDPTLPSPDTATCASAARTTPGDPSVDRDLRTIVGGHYSPDHLGPEPFAAIEDHVRREPDAFLDAWARTALDPAAHLDLYWANVLERTAAARPERTRELAACLLARFDAALAHPPADRDPSWAERIGQHRLVTYLQWRAREDDGSWRIAMPSRACTTTTDGVTTLTVEVSCTCGEPIASDVAAGPDRLDALVTFDPRAPGMCDDCYPGTGTCTLPAVPQSALSPTINGLRMPLAPCVH
jgi:AcrR family transcriptional regulator